MSDLRSDGILPSQIKLSANVNNTQFFEWFNSNPLYLHSQNGELAQLARALAWHARGHRFDSGILHNLFSP